MGNRNVTIQVDLNAGGNFGANLKSIQSLVNNFQKNVFATSLNQYVQQRLAGAHEKDMARRKMVLEQGERTVGSPADLQRRKDIYEITKREMALRERDRQADLKVGIGRTSIAARVREQTQGASDAFKWAAGTMTAMTAAGSPETMSTFLKSMQLLAGEVGIGFIPMFARMAVELQAAAQWMREMDAGTKSTLSHAAMLGVSILGIGYAANKVAAVGSWIGAHPVMAGIAAVGMVGAGVATMWSHQSSQEALAFQQHQQRQSQHEQLMAAVGRGETLSPRQVRQAIPAHLVAQFQAFNQLPFSPNTGPLAAAARAGGLPMEGETREQANRRWLQQKIEMVQRDLNAMPGNQQQTADVLAAALTPLANRSGLTEPTVWPRIQAMMAAQGHSLGANVNQLIYQSVVGGAWNLNEENLNRRVQAGNMTPQAAAELRELWARLQPVMNILRQDVMSPADITAVAGAGSQLPRRQMLEGALAGLQQLLRDPNLALNPQMAGLVLGPNGQPIRVEGQNLTQERFRAMVSFGNWQPQQMGIENLHDYLQNQAMRGPLEQQQLEQNQRGLRELLNQMGSIESVLRQIFGVTETAENNGGMGP